MDEHLELDIRKGYSEYYSEFKGLSIWIEGLLEQLIFHDPWVYTFDVRVKTIESLLKKTIVRMDKEHKESFTCTCFNDVRKHIKDIVGARILVYIPDVLRKLHALITAMDSDLLIVKEIRIHYKEDKPTKVIKEIISASKLLEPKTKLNTESNTNGYVGVHYILEPIKADFYKQSRQNIFERFELQVRTVMYHAWSEIQHRAIYKKENPPYELPVRFSALADMISLCDEQLGVLSIDPALPLIETFRSETIPAKFGKIIGEIQKVVIEFETNKIPDSERHDKAQEFLEKHERELAKIADVSTGNIDANIELGELLLKGGYYEKALELYEKCLAITERDGWVLLRLAETCDRLGKTDEALGYVRRLVVLCHENLNLLNLNGFLDMPTH